jgi:hypothetical protein
MPFDQQEILIAHKRSSILGNSDQFKKQTIGDYDQFENKLILSGSSKKIKEFLAN